MEVFNQFSNKYITIPDLFASNYVSTLPQHKILTTGFEGYTNPSEYVYSPDFSNVVKKSTDFFFNPFERRQYRESTLPKRINLFSNIGKLQNTYNQAGLLDSSLRVGAEENAKIMGQMDINQATDQINQAVENARIQEETTRRLEEIQRIKQMLGILESQVVVPNTLKQNPSYVPKFNLFN